MPSILSASLQRASRLVGEVLVLVGVAGGLLFGLHHDERALVASLQRTASALAATPVAIGEIGLSVAPALVFRRVRLGQGVTIERVELPLAGGSRLRLVRPTLDLHLAGRRRSPLLSTSPATGGKRPGWLARPWPVTLQQGRVRLIIGSAIRVQMRGVYLDLSAATSGGGRRLVAGATRLWIGGAPRLTVASVALEIDDRGAMHRAAGLGGRVLLPGQSALAVQRIRVTRRPPGGYAVDLLGRAAGDRQGQLRLALTVDRRGRPVALVGKLSQVSLAALAPALESAGLATGGARVSGRLRIDRRTTGTHRFFGALAISTLLLDHPWVASDPVGPFDATLQASGSVSGDALMVERLQLSSGDVTLELEGRLRREPEGGVQLEAGLRVPTVPCQSVLSALPEGFAPRLLGMAVAGEIGARGSLRVDSRALDKTQLDFSLRPMSCRVLVDPPGADVHRLRRPTAIRVVGARGERQRLVLGPSNRYYRPIDRISRNLRAAFIVAEDINFYRHRGFDLYQLERAFVENLRTGALVRGASTISQQLVKNAFLENQRTLSRKFQEVVLTWRLEQVLSKRRILELYLNLVEMGPGLHGVERACRYFFGRGSDNVTPLQATHLAALTPSPRPLARRFAVADPGPAWMERLRLLLRLMRKHGSISRAAEQRWSSSELLLVRRGPTSQPASGR